MYVENVNNINTNIKLNVKDLFINSAHEEFLLTESQLTIIITLGIIIFSTIIFAHRKIIIKSINKIKSSVLSLSGFPVIGNLFKKGNKLNVPQPSKSLVSPDPSIKFKSPIENLLEMTPQLNDRLELIERYSVLNKLSPFEKYNLIDKFVNIPFNVNPFENSRPTIFHSACG
jgi:hypothetical protein